MAATTRNRAPVAIESGGLELRTQEIGGDITVAFARLPAGTGMGPVLKGLPHDMCPCPHWGYVLKGRLTLQTKEGDQIYEAGQAFHWDPGHIPVALEDCDYVDFSPTEEFRQVIEHVKARLG